MWIRSGSTATPSVFSISGRFRAPSCASAPTTVDDVVEAIRTLGGARRAGDRDLRRVRRRARRAAARRRPRRIRSRRGEDSRARDRPRSTSRGRSTACWACRAVRSSPRRRRIHDEQRDVDRRIAEASVELFPASGNVLTHCNTGPIATGGDGTALGCFIAAHRAGKALHVFVDETRPLLQGARLTMFELHEGGVPCTLIVDSRGGDHDAAQGGARGGRRRGPHRAQRRHREQDRHVRRRDRRGASRHSVLRRRAALDVRLHACNPAKRSRSKSARPTKCASPPSDAVYNPAFDVTPGRLDHRLHHRVRRDPSAVRRRHRRPRAPAAHSLPVA